MSEVETHLGRLRRQRGFSAAHLAQRAGVSRQTVYAMEAGGYVPNTAVALRLARALDASVEELFRLGGAAPPVKLRVERVTLLPGSEALQPGQPVQLCRVDRRMIATSPAPFRWYFPASDAVVGSPASAKEKIQVQVFAGADSPAPHRILVAGCDPGISVLAHQMQTAGIELVLAHRNSSQALTLLKEGCVHIAGTHLRDAASDESNLPAIGRMFAKKGVAVISFARWEEGLLTARTNPRSIKGIADLARADVRLVNREKGAGCRNLLDTQLKLLGIDSRRVRGYDDAVAGHLPIAWRIQSGLADCGIATRGAARLFGLGFIPLVSERYDLVIRSRDLDLPGMQALLDTLSHANFRRKLESLGGYDTKVAGQRML